VTAADSSYGTALGELAVVLPKLAATLERAERHRARNTASLVGGARFKGIEELLRHLDELHQAFAGDSVLQRIAFLIQRSHADLQTATEATLSGYMAVAADAMRDVMEIENLLLDFAVNPAHIDEWLTADRRTLLKKFGPAKIRDRLHAAAEGRYAATAESIDYRAHSAALHVGPHRNPVAEKGFSTNRGWGGDAGFWEIFQHMRRLRRAIQRLTGVLAPDSAVDQLARQALTDVEDAWKRTQEMQAIYVALLKANMKSQTEDRGDA
jgi:hypothetical protein